MRRSVINCLPDLQRQKFGTVAGLVGSTWRHYYRALHPAFRCAPPTDYAPVRWSEVALHRNLEIDDYGAVGWEHISGVKPNYGLPLPDDLVLEPFEGPFAAATLRAVLQCVFNVFNDQCVAFAQWAGYGDVTRSGRDEFAIGPEAYLAAQLPAAALLTALTGADGDIGTHNMLPNIIWASSGAWIIHSDFDCRSTYVGTSTMIADTADLEWARTQPTSAVS
jgi:hypothetical protein